MRAHPVVLRPASAARSVRPADLERAIGDPLIGVELSQHADSLRRVVGQVFSRPEYEWVEQQRVLSWLARQWQNLINALGRLSEQHPVAFNIGLALVVVALVFVLVHIGYVIWRILQPGVRSGQAGAPVAGGVIMDAAAHIRLADELARGGRYVEALAHRFLAVVLELDRKRALRFHASKTPAEYIGEARLDDRGRASLAGLVAQLYAHLFGAVPCDASQYEAFRIDADRLAQGAGTGTGMGAGAHVLPA